MHPPTPLYHECSGWLAALRSSPLFMFDDLPHFRESPEADGVGVYAIWLRFKEWKRWLCLKIGKAQRKSKKSLFRRVYDHWHSRHLPNPNVLAAHLMADVALQQAVTDPPIPNLQDQEGRRMFLERWCRFQVVKVREDITPRQLAILECRLAAELEPRYLDHCGGYPPLGEPVPEALQPTGPGS